MFQNEGCKYKLMEIIQKTIYSSDSFNFLTSQQALIKLNLVQKQHPKRNIGLGQTYSIRIDHISENRLKM